MKIGIGSDHRGFVKKEQIIVYLKKLGHTVVDYGTNSSESTDYPLYAFKLGEDIKNIDLGILICGTGIGVCIAANKVKGVRCAKVDSVKDAKHSKIDNNANVMSFGEDVSMFKAKKMINAFINTPFSNGERHIRRANMIDNYVNKL